MTKWIEVELPETLTVHEAQSFKQQILEEIHKGLHIKLSGKNVRHIDSAGIQLLVATYKTMRREKRLLKLVKASEQLADALKLTGADKLFKDH